MLQCSEPLGEPRQQQDDAYHIAFAAFFIAAADPASAAQGTRHRLLPLCSAAEILKGGTRPCDWSW